MKFLFLAAMLACSGTTAMAASCVDASGKDITNNPDAFQALIEQQTECYNAAELAEACAWGSSLDIHTAGAAYGVCKAQMDKANPAPALNTLLDSMNDLCNKKYENMQGTLYLSMHAYCRLSAIRWVNNIAQPVE